MTLIPAYLLLGTLTLFSSIAAARSLEAIKQTGELKVAIRDNLPPMEFIENGKLLGIDPELAEMLAQSLGVKLQRVSFKEAKERETLLIQQTVDAVISVYSVTEKRMELVSFSEPYFDSGSVILIRQTDKDKIKTYKDLAGKNVATTRGSVSAETLEAVIPTATSTLLPNGINQGFAMLKAGKVDAVLYDKPVLDFVASKDKTLAVVKEDPIDPNQYAIGLNLQDKELLDHVNQFLQEIKSNGKLKALLNNYSTGSVELAPVDPKLKTRSYLIKEGDTLSKIALQEYADASLWTKIYEYNRDRIAYANVIKHGQTLKLPDLPIKSKTIDKMRASHPSNVSKQSNCHDQLEKLQKLQDVLSKSGYQDQEKRILAECQP